MNWQKALPATLSLCVVLAGCDSKPKIAEPPPSPAPSVVPNVVTADIQDGIEKHIEDRTRLGKGYFDLAFGEEKLRLKLVRVHTEYLANLGPRRHFACVDLATANGNVYDVDFFLAGDPGDMKVTETTVHKINGQPLYVWEQKADKTWFKADVEGASQALLGVVRERDEFEFLYRATLPEMKAKARAWIPVPPTNQFQTVKLLSVNAPGTRRTVREAKFGNRAFLLEFTPADSGKDIEIRFHVQRLETGAYTAPALEVGEYLEPENMVPVNDTFRGIAEEVVKGKKNDLMRARALYDHVIERMRYAKAGIGWGKGDAVYACDVRTGNCTDFHSYFIALARAIGIPARFAIGAGIPSSRNEGGVDGYHCWAEFYTDGRWWPVDISEGDKYTALATYYFGHHPANRVEFSRGRDLVFEPGPALGPINFFAYPILEIGGEPARMKKPKFSFVRAKQGLSAKK